MNRVWPARSSARLGRLRLLDLHDQLRRGEHASASGTIFAPPPRSRVGEPDAAPAPVSTITSWPFCTSSLAPSGVNATRYSSSLISLGTPTTSIRSLMTVLLFSQVLRLR